jgi:hypothetical protein
LIRGVNYDTGFFGRSRPAFELDQVRRELEIVARDLHCDAVRVSGEHLDRISAAAIVALESGLDVWYAPFPSDLTNAELQRCFVAAAEEAEGLREQFGDRVVLVTGCEISLFNHGFMPGPRDARERIERLMSQTPDPADLAAFRAVDTPVDAFFEDTVSLVRESFGGPVTYASGKWESIDWSRFDLVSVDLYRDSSNEASYLQTLRRYASHGKPFAITEFGCCTYTGAAARGGTGWMILAEDDEPPRVLGVYERNEDEQAGLLRELLELYAREGAHAAFWFTFASYSLPHRSAPADDLDLGAYGLVKMLEDGSGATYPGLPWEPKKSFHALAEIYGRLENDRT